MTTDATRAHIDAERLAAWADHGLPPSAAAEVELHLSQCERCQEVLAAFVRSEPVPAVVIPFFARRPVRWSTAGLAAAAALFLLVRTQLPTVPVPDSVTVRVAEESAAQRKAASPGAPAESDRAAAPAAPDDLNRERRSAEGAARDAKSALADRAESKQAAANERAVRKEQPERAAMPAAPPPQPRPAAAPPPVPVQATAPPPPPVAVVAASPVVTPPTSATAGGRAAGGIPAMNESIVMDSARANVIEIVAPGPAVLRRLAALGPAGRSVAAGRGGAALSEFRQETAPARWRIFAGMRVELSLDSGATWTVLTIDPPLNTPLVAGVAAGQSVCWLVGPEGVVLLTTDGRTFRRVSLPERIQLVSITAEDDLRATVTAADGRRFSTVDGGLTWK